MFKYLFSLFAVVLFTTTAIAQTNDNLYFVFLNSNSNREVLSDEKAEAIQAAHMQNIDKLAKEGKLVAAGPFEDGGGMFILRAESLDEAKSFVETDPAIQAGRLNTEVFPLQLAYNNICGVKEPYEMVTYHFIRFTSTVKNTDQEHKVTHDSRIFWGEFNNKNDNLVTQAYFNNKGDGIAILNVETTKDAEKIIKKHPSVKSGKMNYEIKSLWIAKGTFCE